MITSTLFVLDEFTTACIEALRVTDTGTDSDIPAWAELSDKALAQIVADCAKFQRLASGLIAGGCVRDNGCSDSAMAGHDFWLTRNGHGAGFWDGDWPEVGARLDEIAKHFGGVEPYLGDDGKIYLCR